jgi:hypothetical protein
MSVNSGHVTATPYMSPQSSTWSTSSGTFGTLSTSGETLSVGGVSSGVLNVSGTGSLTSGTLSLLRTTAIANCFAWRPHFAAAGSDNEVTR